MLAAVAAEWSFKEFLAGEWTLERTRGGAVTRAHYSLNMTSEGALEGVYHEEGGEGEESVNHMRVRVLFENPSCRSGSFQLAKVKQPEAWEEGDDEPEPVPVQQPEPKTVFNFAFIPQVDERFWISETRCPRPHHGSQTGLVPDPRPHRPPFFC